MPLATVLTPNILEAAQLTGFPVTDRVDMRRAARALAHQGVPAVVVKGGHLPGAMAADLLWQDGQEHWFEAARIATPHTHGTGCTFASAIAACLAQGMDLVAAVPKAKAYVVGAMVSAPGFGAGAGPLWHQWEAPR